MLKGVKLGLNLLFSELNRFYANSENFLCDKMITAKSISDSADVNLKGLEGNISQTFLNPKH